MVGKVEAVEKRNKRPSVAAGAWQALSELCRDAGVEPPEMPRNPFEVWSVVRRVANNHGLKPRNALEAAICGLEDFEPRKAGRATASVVGSLARVEAYAARVACGEDLWCELDGVSNDRS